MEPRKVYAVSRVAKIESVTTDGDVLRAILAEVKAMSDEELKLEVAQLAGVADQWVIMKRGYFYLPKGNGYTLNIYEAWVVTEAEADKHVYPHDEQVTKHRAPLPDYPHDLNAVHEVEELLTTEQMFVYALKLRDEILELHDDWITFTMAQVIHATARQRCEALVLCLSHDKKDNLGRVREKK